MIIIVLLLFFTKFGKIENKYLSKGFIIDKCVVISENDIEKKFDNKNSKIYWQCKIAMI